MDMMERLKALFYSFRSSDDIKPGKLSSQQHKGFGCMNAIFTLKTMIKTNEPQSLLHWTGKKSQVCPQKDNTITHFPLIFHSVYTGMTISSLEKSLEDLCIYLDLNDIFICTIPSHHTLIWTTFANLFKYKCNF